MRSLYDWRPLRLRGSVLLDWRQLTKNTEAPYQVQNSQISRTVMFRCPVEVEEHLGERKLQELGQLSRHAEFVVPDLEALGRISEPL